MAGNIPVELSDDESVERQSMEVGGCIYDNALEKEIHDDKYENQGKSSGFLNEKYEAVQCHIENCRVAFYLFGPREEGY